MKTVRKADETTKQRLQRVTESSRPFHAELRERKYLVAAALLVLIATLVAVGVVGGMLGYDVFYEHARQIAAWAAGGGR